jgi:hypothetical protein
VPSVSGGSLPRSSCLSVWGTPLGMALMPHRNKLPPTCATGCPLAPSALMREKQRGTLVVRYPRVEGVNGPRLQRVLAHQSLLTMRRARCGRCLAVARDVARAQALRPVELC